MARLEAARTYGNWRRPASAGLMGLGSVGTALMLAGLMTVVMAVMIAGLQAGLVMMGMTGLMLLLVLTKDSHGRNLVSRMGARMGWWVTRSQGSNVYRSGVVGQTPWGTCQLPGIVAGTRLSEWTDSYGRPFALVQTPSVGSYSVVFISEPDGSSLVDPEQVDTWVAHWGHWLSTLGDEPGIEGASVTIETAPDTGARLRREVQMNIDPQAPAFAKAMLERTVDIYPLGSSSVKAYVTLTFSAVPRPGASKRSPEQMGRDLASRLPGLGASLHATGAGAARPMTAQELCETVRVAYDPTAAALIDDAHAAGEVPELTWPDVGPTAAQANWASYRHDSATSVTWMMSSAPRGVVQSSVLSRLLAPHRDIARKRVTLVYRPIDPARSAAIVEADLRAAEFRHTATRKPSARDTVSLRAASAAAAEEAAGAGLVNFGLLLTATVLDPAGLPEASAAVDNLAATARLRLRRVHGSQDSAFAACLPLGLVLNKHIQVPTELRDKL